MQEKTERIAQTRRVERQVTFSVWICNHPDHAHKTEAAAQKCIDRHPFVSHAQRREAALDRASEILALHYDQGESVASIMAATGLTRGQVKKVVGRIEWLCGYSLPWCGSYPALLGKPEWDFGAGPYDDYQRRNEQWLREPEQAAIVARINEVFTAMLRERVASGESGLLLLDVTDPTMKSIMQSACAAVTSAPPDI